MEKKNEFMSICKKIMNQKDYVELQFLIVKFKTKQIKEEEFKQKFFDLFSKYNEHLNEKMNINFITNKY
jgi:hypothetical protein